MIEIGDVVTMPDGHPFAGMTCVVEAVDGPAIRVRRKEPRPYKRIVYGGDEYEDIELRIDVAYATADQCLK